MKLSYVIITRNRRQRLLQTLQRLIDRGLYGDRRDPVRAVSLVGERLAGTGTTGLAGVLEAAT